MKQGVDIISMSFVLRDTKPEVKDQLRKAVHAAAAKEILMFCSTADAETKYQDALPAAFVETFLMSITSRDQAGTPVAEKWSSDGHATYHFRGTNFHSKDIHYITDPNTSVSGSSIATALAAGVASLILACDRMCNGENPSPKIFLISEKFDMMTSGGSKYV